jgi:hypothetical protein
LVSLGLALVALAKRRWPSVSGYSKDDPWNTNKGAASLPSLDTGQYASATSPVLGWMEAGGHSPLGRRDACPAGGNASTYYR